MVFTYREGGGPHTPKERTVAFDIATLTTRLTTIDAAAERRFNKTSQEMVAARTNRLRQLIGAGADQATLYEAVVDMKGWAYFGGLQSINWLERELNKLADYLEPTEVCLANAEVAARITNDLMEVDH